MCVVSNITGYHQQRWGEPWIDPNQFNTKKITIDWEEYMKLRRIAEEYDKKTGQPECVKPDLLEWEKRMENFLKEKGLL